MVKVKVRVPKGFKVRKIEMRGGIPPGKTTFLLYLSRRNIPIPFPKKVIVSGTGYKSRGGGRDSAGDYLAYENKRR